MPYPDTSILVAALTSEPNGEQALVWLAEHGDHLIISDWTIAEFASALALKQRTGRLRADQRDAAAKWFRDLRRDVAEVIAVRRPNFRRAAELVAMPGSVLRAPDALHLAVAESNGLAIHTLDKDQATAGAAAGIAAHLLN